MKNNLIAISLMLILFIGINVQAQSEAENSCLAQYDLEIKEITVNAELSRHLFRNEEIKSSVGFVAGIIPGGILANKIGPDDQGNQRVILPLLVTGASGMVGSVLSNQLLTSDEDRSELKEVRESLKRKRVLVEPHAVLMSADILTGNYSVIDIESNISNAMATLRRFRTWARLGSDYDLELLAEEIMEEDRNETFCQDGDLMSYTEMVSVFKEAN